MKYNLIFKEKRKKIYFFINLSYLLKLISFFDFADFELLNFFNIIFISEKFRINKFFIFALLDNFFIIKNIKKIKIITQFKLPTLNFLCSFFNKCAFFVKYTFKLPIITLPIFFLLYSEHIFEYILSFKINNKYKIFKKNLIYSVLILKKYFNFFKEILKENIRIYLYLLLKLSEEFDYTSLNMYELRSFFFKYVLHYKFQEYLKEKITYKYI